MIKVLFVCLGNICRSPAAEAIFKKMVDEKGLSDQFEIDSAGTSAYHQGHPADPRMIETGKTLGYDLASISRPFDHADFEHYDYIVAMDHSNLYHILAMLYDEAHRDKVVTMCEFCKDHNEKDVPDPYYGGPEGFANVFHLLEDACNGLLEKIGEKNE